MVQRTKIVFALGLLVLLTACQELPRYFSADEVVAKAADRELRRRDVEAVVPQGVTGADSAAFMDLYVDRWIKRCLKVAEAEQMFSEAEDDIDRMVEEYREALLIRKLEQHYVDRKIDTVFTAEEIEAYYAEHKADFKLDHAIVKGRIVRIPKLYRQAAQLKSLMGSTNDDKQKDFHDLCVKNNFEVNDLCGQWIDFSEFLSLLPTLRSESYEKLLVTPGVQEMEGREARFYFQITAVQRAGEPIPLERVESMIRRILFNRRQSEIIREHEQELYDLGVAEGDVKIAVERKTDTLGMRRVAE